MLAVSGFRSLPGGSACTHSSLARWRRRRQRRGFKAIVGVWIHFWRDGVSQHAEPFDIDLHDIPWLEIAGWEAIAYGLTDGPASDRAAAQNVAWGNAAVPRGALDHGAPRVVHQTTVVVHPLHAVDFQGAVDMHAAVADVGRQLICGDDPGTERGGRVFPLGRAEACLHLVALQVAATPVIKDGEASDVRECVSLGDIATFPANDGGQFQLVIELIGSGWVGHRLVWTKDAQRAREVKNRQPIPGV